MEKLTRLSRDQMIIVVEPSPYPVKTDLGAWLRIAHISTQLFTVSQLVSLGHIPGFPVCLVLFGFRGFPQFNIFAQGNIDFRALVPVDKVKCFSNY